MTGRGMAVWAVAIGAVMGVLGNALFYNQQIGLSFPLYIGAGVALVLAFSAASRQQVRLRNLWTVLPMLFFAVMVAVRADALVVMLNIAAVLTLGALTLYYVPLERTLDTDSFGSYVAHTIVSSFLILPSAVGETREAGHWLRERSSSAGQTAVSILRGLLFTVPILLVFSVLLSSADAVFADAMRQSFDGLFKLLGLVSPDDFVGRTVLTLFLAGTAVGALGVAVRHHDSTPTTQPAEELPDLEEVVLGPKHKAADEKRKPFFKLSMIESGMILGGVVLLFAAFVAIQFAYFFGGRTNITLQGLTYAQYARRGFFELVAVSIMTLGLAFVLDRSTVRSVRREHTIFRVLCLLLVGLTMVILVSASQRMLLYEEAYGFTLLRVYTQVAMFWIGVLFLFFVLDMFRLRKNILSLGILLTVIGYLATLNMMNMDYYIAEHNIARFRNGQELDTAYLNILSVDALPLVVGLFNDTPKGSSTHEWAGEWLACQLYGLNLQSNQGLAAANAARGTASAQLSQLDAALAEYKTPKDTGRLYTYASRCRFEAEFGLKFWRMLR